MGNIVSLNPLRTRADVERAAVQLIEPLIPLLSPGKARLHLGETGAVYPADIAEMEAFARPLWAIVPMLAGGCEAVEPIWAHWKQGIIHGVDPAHPEYWGEVVDYDQRLVEMAVFGMGMALAPQRFFFELPETAQKNLHAWLDQINRRDMPKNNWIFFRVLVNAGFMICGLPYDRARLESDFALIESHYEGEGWYNDYVNQHDYYTMWAFHFYGMVYARAMKDIDPQRAQTYTERGRQMAGQLASWFDTTGEALAYGRSLTYRFAQSAFYAALALVDGETGAVPFGAMKHLLLANMRKWFSKPIFTRDGVLTIGYGYPSLLMAEGYNAPGSPYWAMKSFACLALPADHPFWTGEECEPAVPERMLMEPMGMIVVRSEGGRHVTAYPAGNYCREHAHDEAKYEKFAYSTVFGFSVSKAQKLLKDGAFDSMLALSDDGLTWHPRYRAVQGSAASEKAVSTWHPFADVTVSTQIIPLGSWHVRIHKITTPRKLYAAEGAFALARDPQADVELIAGDGKAAAIAPWGSTGVIGLRGYGESEIVTPEPNTNLMSPRTLLPTLHAQLLPGEHTLICAVLGMAKRAKDEWANPPAEVLAYGKMD